MVEAGMELHSAYLVAPGRLILLLVEGVHLPRELCVCERETQEWEG